MEREKILNYLGQKKDRTADVQNARYDLFKSNKSYTVLKKQFKKRLIILLIGSILVPIMFGNLIESVPSGASIVVCLWWGILGFLIYIRFKQGRQARKQILLAKQKLQDAQNQPKYLEGMKDFPNKFYSYWTIDRLMHLIQENRATTLQEAFNVAEAQDFQNDQILLQQQNLAVTKSTNSMSKVSAAANIFTAFNTRK